MGIPDWPPEVVAPTGHCHAMSRPEIDQFLACGRMGRLAMVLGDGPYVIPVGYGYADGQIFIHTCGQGLKMELLRENPNVCFEVDEAISDSSLGKSVILFGRAEIISEKAQMIPYLQRLIDKYRVPISFGEYMKRGDREAQKELEQVRIIRIVPSRISGRSLVRTNSNF